MPGTQASSEYKEAKAQLAKFQEQWNKEANAKKRDPEVLQAIRAAWDEFDDNFRARTGGGFAPAAVLYLVIAAALAALFASTIYGAIGIGLGLTGIMSTIGTQQQKEKSDGVKNKALDDLIKEAEALGSTFKPTIAVLQGAANTPKITESLRMLESNNLPELSNLVSSAGNNSIQLDRLHKAIAEAEKAKAL